MSTKLNGLFFNGESIAGWVEDPWVVIWAFHASEETYCLTWEFPGCQWAGVWQRAEGLSLNVALFFPFLEISQSGQFSWVLHPLDNLQHGYEVNVVSAQHLFDELDEFFFEFLFALQPGSVEVKTEWSTVGIEMTVEVMTQETGKLITSLDV